MNSLLPAKTATAAEMADRVVRVAAALTDIDIKPVSLSCGVSYLWASEGAPMVEDAVAMHVPAEQFQAAADTLGLDPAVGDHGNAYRSGIWEGIAVLAYTAFAGLVAVHGEGIFAQVSE